MSDEIKTLELARIYEAQGYVKDALDIYSFLHAQTPSKEIQAGLNRMRTRLETQALNQPEDQKNDQLFSLIQSSGSDPVMDSDMGHDLDPRTIFSQRIEKWFTLLVMEERMIRMKTLKHKCR